MPAKKAIDLSAPIPVIRVGLEERIAGVPPEDYAKDLAEAKTALRAAGLRPVYWFKAEYRQQAKEMRDRMRAAVADFGLAVTISDGTRHINIAANAKRRKPR